MFLAAFALAGTAQFYRPQKEPPREWLPQAMTYPSKITADRLENAEHPSITRDAAGAVWIAWSSCRPQTDAWPVGEADIDAWMWPDDGEDSIYIRRYDGKDWSDEQTVSAVPGINLKPSVAADGDGVRVLWTARRGGRWAAYERRYDGREWSPERRIPGTEDVLEIRAKTLTDGRLLAVARKMVPPRLELHALTLAGGSWSAPQRLDEGRGRCHRAHLLPLDGGGWRVAWDEERDGNYDVFARRDGGAVERLTTSPLWDTAPTQAVGSDGRPWIAWERREPYGGRFAYHGRSIFAKILEADRWSWAPSPFEASADPGRLTRHSEYWAAHAMSEERYPQLLARDNGEMWLFWLGGGRMSSVSFSGRVLRAGKWSAPKMIFRDSNPYTAFQLPSVKKGVDLASSGRGPYQVPLANQFALALDDATGWLWAAYEVPRRRHIADRLWNGDITQRPGGYGADIYSHRIDLDERAARFAEVVDVQEPIDALAPREFRRDATKTLTVDGRTYSLVWGDMHGHTENDGIGTFDMYYAHGLFVTGMDFVASTNHDFTPDFLTQSEWAEVQALASVYEAAEGRVAFSGWEWTTDAQDERGGHRAMYFLQDNAPLFRSTTTGSDTVYKLYSLIRPWDVILQPHHNDWSGYDARLQPIFEITSAWRQAREEAKKFKPRGPVASVWEALERGYRIGFVGSGDSHWMGVGEDFGITGAYVDDVSREGVFDAVRSKRVFASTGARVLIDFRVNGAFLGDQIEAEKGKPLKLEVRVEGDGPLDVVEIVKDHKVIHASSGSGATAQFEYLDQSGPRADGKASYLYLRVRQKDEQYAWASPIWVDWK
ncbi:MAG: hypothetical protein GC160_07470 [Acidobacteria bacterium]|nr:hypothetical protein [Acidobacteriota bacterium]